jgi:hypothetical protein
MAAGMLEHDPDLRPDVRADLAMIKRNVELETKLIDDLLDLNRITGHRARSQLLAGPGGLRRPDGRGCRGSRRHGRAGAL